MISIQQVEPRYQETDQMGIIHHSVYPIWYEMGRVKFCQDINLPFYAIEEAGVMLAMYHLESNYIKPAKFGHTYQLETKCVHLTPVRIIFHYDLYDNNHELIHQGKTELIWLNKTLRPTNIKKTHPIIYQTFEKEITE